MSEGTEGESVLKEVIEEPSMVELVKEATEYWRPFNETLSREARQEWRNKRVYRDLEGYQARLAWEAAEIKKWKEKHASI